MKKPCSVSPCNCNISQIQEKVLEMMFRRLRFRPRAKRLPRPARWLMMT